MLLGIISSWCGGQRRSEKKRRKKGSNSRDLYFKPVNLLRTTCPSLSLIRILQLGTGLRPRKLALRPGGKMLEQGMSEENIDLR